MGKLRTIMAEEGMRTPGMKTSADEVSPEMVALFQEALSSLIDHAELPRLKTPFKGFQHRGKQSQPIPVPPGFESLFKTLEIELQMFQESWGLYGTLTWRYQHPNGSNGYSIGSASVENLEPGKPPKYGWRMESGTFKML